MKIILETERFIIREILLTDVDGMYDLHSDPEVHKYLGNSTITDKKKIVDVINYVRRQYVDTGVGRWAIIDKNTNEFVGWTGLELVTEEMNKHINYYDLGYRLIKRYWGQGIATETAFASLEYAFNKLNADDVYARVDCDNVGSNKVLTKVGLRFIEEFDLHGVKHNWYKIDKGEFKKTSSNTFI
ncbi:MAG: GNAT family N-acetyltransferase [Sporocytophaga sp.]|uniref:GNAT family N-acetyltransferase n=1 Tax=Sporocytophaga sp. TaxID=2231183 RepID=UPI001B031AE0|nr:GNAT family N-acetyltransferase [Sporocytophaga sp.]MBO9699955.1 GNAT family N-acetyltransferase [Sporocytophaga sp.]